jgi:hypothetical protein
MMRPRIELVSLRNNQFCGKVSAVEPTIGGLRRGDVALELPKAYTD